MRVILLPAGLFLNLCLMTSVFAADAPKVVVSIKPLHSLVSMVMKRIAEPALLMKGRESPHTYALKPSDAVALQGADVVFRIGPDLETFLNRPLESLGQDANVVDLAKTPGLVTLGVRSEGMFERFGAAEGNGDGERHDRTERRNGAENGDHDHEDDHGHEHTTFDMHIWLDPDNARHMIRRIADIMIEADPVRVDLYRANAVAALVALDRLSSRTDMLLEPARGKPFIVFHDAYRYFERRFGLRAAGSIVVNPQTPPGAETLAELRDSIGAAGILCAFVEPQFSPKTIEAIAGGANIRIGRLDPLGADIAAGPDHYKTLIRTMAQSFGDCLNSRP